jgi:hypothetical protein
MFLETTPDTSGYMIAGFVVAFTVMGVYIASMALRHRNLRRDLEMLESLGAKSKLKAVKKQPAAKSGKKPAKKK